LKLKSEEKNTISCFIFGSSNSSEIETHKIKLDLVNDKGISRTLLFDTSPCITGEFCSCPKPSVIDSILPKHFQYADPDIFTSDQRSLEILIGNDLYHNVVDATKVKVLDSGVVLLKSLFGWISSGSIASGASQTSTLITGPSLETIEEETPELDTNGFDE